MGRQLHGAVDINVLDSSAFVEGPVGVGREQNNVAGLLAGEDSDQNGQRRCRRLACPRPRENAQRPARALDGSTLFGVQPREDRLGVQGEEASAATGRLP